MPCLRIKSATFTPAAASFRMPMICSSLYRVLRICPPRSVVPEDSHASWTCSRGLGHFKVHRCLILLPQDAPPIVQFNDEIGWEAMVRLGPAVVLKEGDSVFLSQVASVDMVRPPKVDGKRVACIFLYRVGAHWMLALDMMPNLPPKIGRASC